MSQKRLLIAFLVLCTAGLLIGTILPVHGEEEVYDTVVRLHVLANSDSEEDQALKLKVRDAVLAITGPMLEGCSDQAEALRRLEAGMEEIRSAAEDVIAKEGNGERVTLELGEEEYPKRDYDSFCFPSGTYVSLRICIGDAEGQNWWCCLFPRLCTFFITTLSTLMATMPFRLTFSTPQAMAGTMGSASAAQEMDTFSISTRSMGFSGNPRKYPAQATSVAFTLRKAIRPMRGVRSSTICFSRLWTYSVLPSGSQK